jgi:hypothetical protein
MAGAIPVRQLRGMAMRRIEWRLWQWWQSLSVIKTLSAKFWRLN